MVKRKTAIRIRKTHRYLGIFLGIQFLMWTISGMYFSWTDIDEIHGDHFRREEPLPRNFSDLMAAPNMPQLDTISSLRLLSVAGIPHFWINQSELYNARTGEKRNGITAQEALVIADRFMSPELEVAEITRIEEVDAHHEYRGRPLPAYEISYNSDNNLKAYVAIANGEFQTVRYRDWRWFDFLWMTHTMDYQGRDNFNTIILRAFSLLGLITVFSGFLLWYTSSPTMRKWKKKVLT
ncbi:PepSY domain-containing protein [Zeaxanthinibacter sp. PT1]|uniref:PepSY domain-containing protein n=1 Tax=Zeaxanthinibacter TaxID=561554 RepID=UPI002348FE59|nr:PepSY domain-containing protein [Zeaxanthinibacter sp. PT1]MDC6350171.1 PepSY domain-containing protein [Zeaxanthinibacter sp. PT1]